MIVFFLKQKTAYEMRISDWSSDVCSSDLLFRGLLDEIRQQVRRDPAQVVERVDGIGAAPGTLLGGQTWLLEIHPLVTQSLRDAESRHVGNVVLLQQGDEGGIDRFVGHAVQQHVGDRKRQRLNSSH